jgi:hypothetical protein
MSIVVIIIIMDLKAFSFTPNFVKSNRVKSSDIMSRISQVARPVALL